MQWLLGKTVRISGEYRAMIIGAHGEFCISPPHPRFGNSVDINRCELESHEGWFPFQITPLEFSWNDVDTLHAVAQRAPMGPWDDVVAVADKISKLLPPRQADKS